MEEDLFPINKIQISGATLASLLHRASSSAGDIHGYLFGIATLSTPNPLSDHPTPTPPTPLLTATITSFLSLPSHLPLPPPETPAGKPLLGWFSARRKTPLRPSLNDSTTTHSLSSSTSLQFTPQNSSTFSLQPSLFLLLTTPFHDNLIHTHEYKAFRFKGHAFDPKTLDIVNIGPTFRSQYESFSPNLGFPMINCELRGSNAMLEDGKGETLADRKKQLNDQKQLDICAEGFSIDRMSKLVRSAYTGELEDLYDKMLVKIDGLSRLVEQTNAKVLEQENHNMRLRYKVAGLE